MGFLEAYKLLWKNAFNYDERATREEYWFVFFWHIIITGVLYCGYILFGVERFAGYTTGVNSTGFIILLLGAVYTLVVFIPWLSLSIRRLHDSGKRGFWVLMMFIPYVGGLVLFIFMCFPSDGPNFYGEPVVHGDSASAEEV
ncbi:DUF805 domain-containing protein [Listeria monocytogenes]|nr:DUF805 domain-containing protein [Listeria monocytogenes]EIM8286384.1 DUF805 domain-containing protein [Listeria monocytogenes]